MNDEVGKLEKILARANRWHLLADAYDPLDVPFDQPRRIMTKQEEAHLLAVAASRPEFAFICAYCVLSMNTSAAGAELRGLRIIDVDLIGQTLQVNAASAKMWDKYSQVRLESIRDKTTEAFDSSSHRTDSGYRQALPQPKTPAEQPVRPAISAVDPTDPAIQKLIASQVAAAVTQALERERGKICLPIPGEHSGPRLVRFPGRGNSHA